MSIAARRHQRATSASPSTEPLSITHGQQVNASNTGIAALGISESSLTVVNGSMTISTAGATVSNRKILGTVYINAANVTLENCVIEFGGANTFGVKIQGSNATVRNCVIRAASGTSYYNSIALADGSQVISCDIRGGENLVQASCDDALVDMCYLHDPSIVSDTAGHADGFELFKLHDMTIKRCRLSTVNFPDGAINLSPFGSPSSDTDGLYVLDNFIDGGQAHLLIDNQANNSTDLLNIQVLRNVFGGHTDTGTYGRYKALNDHDGRGTVETTTAQASTPRKILWPTSGTDANHWGECNDISPDNTGQIALP